MLEYMQLIGYFDFVGTGLATICNRFLFHKFNRIKDGREHPLQEGVMHSTHRFTFKDRD